MRRNLTLSCLASLLGLLALAAPASALTAPRDLAGAALHPWRLETRPYAPLWPLRDPTLRFKSFSRLRAAGVRYARVDLKWSSVEPDSALVRDWSEFDATVAEAFARGVQLEPIVAFTPEWANGGAGPFAYPTHPADFQAFMTAAFKRYPNIRAWEIWNEPNTVLFSPPRPDPLKFVAILRAAYRARAAAGSTAKLITGGITRDGEVGISDFGTAVARLGGFRYADVLGVHPYSRQRPDEQGSTFLELPKLHEDVSRAAGRPVDLWVTEYGYPTVPIATSYGPPADEREQGLRLRKAFALAVGWPWLKRLIWYGFRDDCDYLHPDCRFGLLRSNFAPKVSWGDLGWVLGGNLTKLDSRITLRRRSYGRRHTLSGTLVTPGTDPARGSVLVTATRRYRGSTRRRRFRRSLSDGAYRVSLGRLRPGRWRFRADFRGDSRYSSARSRSLRLRVR